MANHFPAIPADYELSQLIYSAELPAPSARSGGPLDFGTQVRAFLNYPVTSFGVSLVFSPPGDTGSFDQDVFEAEFTVAINGVCAVMAAMSGDSLAVVQQQVTVTRNWSWTSPSASGGAMLTDYMYFPAPLSDTDAGSGHEQEEQI